MLHWAQEVIAVVCHSDDALTATLPDGVALPNKPAIRTDRVLACALHACNLDA